MSYRITSLLHPLKLRQVNLALNWSSFHASLAKYSSDSSGNSPKGGNGNNPGSPTAQVEKFRSQDGVFNPSRGREVFQNPVENASHTDQNSSYRYSDAEEVNNDDMEHVTAYNMSQNVSLSAVMQTNVPEPFTTTGKAPVHLNMPGGSLSQGQKYLSEWRQSTHQGAHNSQHSSNSTSNDPKQSWTWQYQEVISVSQREDEQKRYCHSQSASSKEGEANKPTEGEAAPLTRAQKLKQAVRDYGATVIVFHVTISLASLGGCYLAITSGLDLPLLLSKIGISETITSNQVAVGGSTFVIAYAVHKVFAPVRIAITLSTTPFIVRYLRGKGILKPPKAKKP